MIVPPASDPLWKDLVTGQIPYNCEFMAAKVLLTRISASVSYDQSRIGKGIEELRTLFEKNITVPKVQADLWSLFGSKYRMPSAVYTVDEVAKNLAEGKSLLLAGSEETLNRVPKGNWIGGTSPLISGLQLGRQAKDRIFAAEIPDFHKGVDIRIYESPETLRHVFTDAPDNGFSVVIIPAYGEMHLSFALNAPNYPDFATRPLAGWISGVPLSELGRLSAKVYLGPKAQAYSDAAVVMSVRLPPTKIAEIGVVNIFEQGNGDILTVEADGFEHKTVQVNGAAVNFADYVRAKWTDTRLPLVANYHGLMVNTSFQKITAEKGVLFYAPLFRGIQYRIAKPITNYKKTFLEKLPFLESQTEVCSFDCILNYLLMIGLESEHQEILLGPATFGEVAYQLLNQTLAYVTIKDIER